jgi:hypothetical protein
MADIGVMAVFDNEDDILKAAHQVREKNYQGFDTFTPFPVHGMDEAMGLKRSFLPWITLGGGIAGLSFAAFLQIWTSAFDWPINIGGKPLVSLPAFVPIFFELTVLLAGLSTVAGLFAVCGLPNKNARILHPDITNDKFVLFIPAKGKNFNPTEVSQFLKSLKPLEVSVVKE